MQIFIRFTGYLPMSTIYLNITALTTPGLAASSYYYGEKFR